MSAAPGHTPATALTVAAPTAVPAVYSGNVGFASNVDDYYKFTLASAQKVTMNVTSLTDNADLDIQDASGNELFFSGSAGLTPENVTKFLDAGTYYVDVQGYSALSADYALTLSATGILPTDAGHTRSTATDLGTVTTTTVAGTASPSYLDDWYKFYSPAGYFSAVASGLKPNEGVLEVYNSAGAKVSPNIDPNNPPDPSVLGFPATSLSAGTYYLHLGSTTSNTKPFSINLTAGAAAAVKAGGYDASSAVDLGTITTTPRTVNSFVQLTIPSDYFKVTMASAGNLNLTLSGVAGPAIVQVQSLGQTLIQQSTYAGSGVNQTISVPLSAGTYYVDVTLTGQVSTNYKLALATGAATPTDSAGSTVATALDLGTIGASTKTFSDYFANANGKDYYKFNVTAKSTLSMNEGALNNASLTLLAADGTTVIDSSTAAGATTASLNDTVAAGTYYALVTYSGPAANYNISLSAVALPTDKAGSTVGTALSLGTVGAAVVSYTDYFANANGNDYYTFNVAAKSTLNLSESALNGASFTLLASDGSTAIDSKTAVGASGLNLSDTVAAGTYYLLVNYGGAPAYYNLSLSATAVPTDNAGSTVATALDLGTIGATTRNVSDYFANANGSDYYRFNVTAKSTLSLSESTLPNATLTLLASDGSTALDAKTAVGAQTLSLSDTVNPGTYYVLVTYTGPGAYYGLTLVANPLPVDNAGSTVATALDLGTIGATTRNVTDYFGNANGSDYYKFNVTTKSTLSLSETTLPNATLTLLASDGSTVIDAKTASGAQTLSLTDPVNPGTYYVLVNYAGPAAYYNLSLLANPLPVDKAGSTIGTALDLGTITGTTKAVSNYFANANGRDYFKFNVAVGSTLSLSEASLNGAALTLIASDGTTVLDTRTAVGTGAASLTDVVTPGTYYALVNYGGAPANYTLSLLATPLPVDKAGSTVATALNLGTIGSTATTYNDYFANSNGKDYYKFTVAANSTLALSETALNNATFTLLASDGTTVIDAKTAVGAATVALSDTVNAGTYYLLVSYGGASANYSLSLKATPVVAPPTDKAGSTLATALDLGTLASAATNVSNYFANANGKDYYKFTVSATSTFALTEASLNGANVALYSSNGTTVLDSKTAVGAANVAMTDSLTAGTYYLLVNYTGAPANYTLALSATPVGGPVDGAGNDPAHARVVTLGANGTFTYFDDYVGTTDANDYYTFTLTQTTKMTEWVSRTTAGVVKLTLTDANGNVVDSSTSTFGYNASGPILDALPAGKYYLDVTPLTGQSTNYRVWFLPRQYVDIAGNTPPTAKDAGTIARGTSRVYSDMVGKIDTADYYKVTLSAATTFKVSAIGNVTLTLFSSNGTTVLASGNSLWSKPGSLSKAVAAGTYYVKVGYLTLDSIYNVYLSA